MMKIVRSIAGIFGVVAMAACSSTFDQSMDDQPIATYEQLDVLVNNVQAALGVKFNKAERDQFECTLLTATRGDLHRLTHAQQAINSYIAENEEALNAVIKGGVPVEVVNDAILADPVIAGSVDVIIAVKDGMDSRRDICLRRRQGL